MFLHPFNIKPRDTTRKSILGLPKTKQNTLLEKNIYIL